ncbi:AI-2E family transporter [Halopiger thermotolerans]
MSDTAAPTDWIADRPGLTALGLISALLALFVLLPYLQFVLFGVVLAYILFPVQKRLERYLRPTIAASAVVVGTLLAVLLPLVYVLAVAVRQSLDVVRSLQEGEVSVAVIEALLADAGLAVDLAAVYEANQNRIATAIREVVMGAIGLVGSLPSLFIGLTVTLFVLFALLRDGDRLVAWIQWVVPVDDEVLTDLRSGLDELMWASVVGNVAVAAIQAVMLGVGLAIAGVPAVVFLTVATFVLTLLPLVGAFGVWIPAAAYLIGTGRTTAGGAMIAYGLLVTFSDSYFRPALIGQTEGFNAATVVVGIFGGIVVFGAVGLFVGPVILGGAKLGLDCFARGRTGARPAGLGHPELRPDAESDSDTDQDPDSEQPAADDDRESTE